MPVPVFQQPVIEKAEKKQAEDKPIKEKFAGWAVFFAFLLIAVLVVLGEFAFRDSNRLYNPYYQSCRVESKITFPYFLQGQDVAEGCDIEKYERTRLLLHADVVVPIIIISILIYLFFRGREVSSQARILLYAYLIFIIWISARIITETEYYLLKHSELVGKYIVLISIGIIVSFLIILVQKKFRKKVFKELGR